MPLAINAETGSATHDSQRGPVTCSGKAGRSTGASAISASSQPNRLSPYQMIRRST